MDKQSFQIWRARAIGTACEKGFCSDRTGTMLEWQGSIRRSIQDRLHTHPQVAYFLMLYCLNDL